jgi:hypothetical protein
MKASLEGLTPTSPGFSRLEAIMLSPSKGVIG